MFRFSNCFVIVVFALSICLCAVSSAQSTEEEPAESADYLDEMVVTAGRLEEPREDLTVDVHMIDEMDIERSTASDLGDLLAEEGVGQIVKYPGGLTSFGIRGLHADKNGLALGSRVLVLVDGRNAGTTNVAQLLTNNMGRVEIIRGPASVQYGSSAMGGVVNVITKQGKGEPKGFIRGGYGTFDEDEGTIGTSGTYGNFDWSGTFTRETRNDYDTGDGHEYENTAFDRKDYASLNVGYEFMPKNRLGIIYTRYEGEHIGSPGYFQNIDPDEYKDARNETTDFIYTGRSNNDVLSWEVRYFVGDDRSKIPATGYRRDNDRQGAQIQLSYRPDHTVLTAGFDWVNFDIKQDGPRRNEYDNPAFYLMAKRKLLDDRLTVSGGVRYDQYDVDTKEGSLDGSQSDSNTLVNAGIAYLLTESTRLRAHYGEAFRMPSVMELTYDANFWGTTYQGNPDLNPEKSKTYEAGIEYFPGHLESSLTYFYTDFEDKIERVWTSATSQTWDNVGDAVIQGIEGKADYNFGARFGWGCTLKPYVSVVYLPEFRNEEAHRDLFDTSDVTASYGIVVDEFYGYGSKLDFTYHGDQDLDVGVEKGGFTVANLSIWKSFFQQGDNEGMRVQLDVRNLLDRDYSYVSNASGDNYPMPGRSFFVSLTYEF